MRNTLLASAALLGLAVAIPAFAQTTDANTPASDDSGSMGHSQAMHQKMHAKSSNNGSGDTQSTVAPRLPEPMVGSNATPEQYLMHAQRALQHRRSGEAQEALERAETRLLDRSSAPSAAGEADTSPTVRQISQAREAIGRRDWQQANQIIADILKNPVVAGNAGMGMGGAASMHNDATMHGTMGAAPMATTPMNSPPMGGTANGTTGSTGPQATGAGNSMGSSTPAAAKSEQMGSTPYSTSGSATSPPASVLQIPPGANQP